MCCTTEEDIEDWKERGYEVVWIEEFSYDELTRAQVGMDDMSIAHDDRHHEEKPEYKGVLRFSRNSSFIAPVTWQFCSVNNLTGVDRIRTNLTKWNVENRAVLKHKETGEIVDGYSVYCEPLSLYPDEDHIEQCDRHEEEKVTGDEIESLISVGIEYRCAPFCVCGRRTTAELIEDDELGYPCVGCHRITVDPGVVSPFTGRINPRLRARDPHIGGSPPPLPPPVPLPPVAPEPSAGT